MKALRERWTEKLLQYIAPLFESGRNHQPMRQLALEPQLLFGSIGELIDLRGYPLHQLVSNQAQYLDFSHARSPKNLNGQDRLVSINACILEHCRFVDVSQFVRCVGTFRSCDFQSSRFVGGALSGQFVDCVFDKSNLSKAVLGDTFTRCTFRHVNLQRATLTMCRFENCIFENCNLKDAWFGDDLNQLPTEKMTIFAPISGAIRYEYNSI